MDPKLPGQSDYCGTPVQYCVLYSTVVPVHERRDRQALPRSWCPILGTDIRRPRTISHHRSNFHSFGSRGCFAFPAVQGGSFCILHQRRAIIASCLSICNPERCDVVTLRDNLDNGWSHLGKVEVHQSTLRLGYGSAGPSVVIDFSLLGEMLRTLSGRKLCQ